jgi:hypothetical protein
MFQVNGLERVIEESLIESIISSQKLRSIGSDSKWSIHPFENAGMISEDC